MLFLAFKSEIGRAVGFQRDIIDAGVYAMSLIFGLMILAVGTPVRAGTDQTIEPIASLLATADAAAGQKTGRVCLTCHSVEKGGGPRIGPNLWNVVNRPHASVAGFNYSKALSATKARTWTYDELNVWLSGPNAYAPGTFMTFAGLKKPEDRANVIAWLRTLSDSPAPLPKSKSPPKS